MLKYVLYIFIFSSCDTPLCAQAKEYKLISRTENADFNYNSLTFIDTSRTRETRRSAFNPVKGKNTVYVFTATYKGLSFTNTEKVFHDILIVKTDSKQNVIDAYQYTLEWAELPFSFDLYKATAKGFTLINQLSIKDFKFRRTDYYEETDKELKETEILKF
jgi:hypothetical protein